MRIPLDFVVVTEQTHVAAALGMADQRIAKIKSKIFLLLTKFLGTMRLKMANPLNIGGHNDYRRLEMLVASIKPQTSRFSGTLCRHYS
ncbi:MAG: hypothetical protein P4L54_10960 [Acidocella sp.]|nr:hypothetical protein [Acidocella sp.]